MDRFKKIFGMESNPPGSPDNQADQSPPNDGTPSNNRSPGMENEISPEDIQDLQDLLDSGLFGNISQLFINSSELQKQIESQLQEIMRHMEGAANDGEFPEIDPKNGLMQDQELKGEDFKRILEHNKGPLISTSPSVRRSDAIGKNKKPSDDERVMDIIHGTKPDTDGPIPSGMLSKRHAIAPFMPPGHPRIDVWTPPGGGTVKGIFQGVITTTVRRPDGSTETKRIAYDKDGNQTTTITTTDKLGNKETRVISGNNGQESAAVEAVPNKINVHRGILSAVRHLFVNSEGYTLPKNLW